ncbi:hypothetical protein RJT34_13797 [Clitoria ternatea]|uniref:Uncharacterized protein n=1 Tax=Clitoria ternatea TaxID=43366 RepID=A0AAN9PKH9_CLITE
MGFHIASGWLPKGKGAVADAFSVVGGHNFGGGQLGKRFSVSILVLLYSVLDGALFIESNRNKDTMDLDPVDALEGNGGNDKGNPSRDSSSCGSSISDGTIEHELDSTSLIPIENPGDHEFVSQQYVVEKTSDDEDPWEFKNEEIVSVYELEGHLDYDYYYGDVVVRLSPVSVGLETAFVGEFCEKSKQKGEESGIKKEAKHQTGKVENASGSETCMEFSDLSWVGNITGLKNDDIEVTWADGIVSTDIIIP